MGEGAAHQLKIRPFNAHLSYTVLNNQFGDFCAFIIICLYYAGAPRVSSQFHQEFPSLQAAGEVEKGDSQEEEPYGPGPSLRPQSMAKLMHIKSS